MKLLLSQLRVELTTMLRNGEQLLLTMGIPVMLLVFFSTVDVLPTGTDEPVEFLLPGVIALAAMSTAMVGLGIATGFERSYLVLKRLATTPLGRGRLIAAKLLAVVAVQLVQLAVLVPVGVLLGWRPHNPNWAIAIGAVALGSAAFVGLGLLLAGRLRGEINLAAQNGLYLVLLLLGSIVVPFSELPGALRAVAHVLPSGALADLLREGLGSAGVRPVASAAVLGGWAIVAPAAAATTFRWW